MGYTNKNVKAQPASTTNTSATSLFTSSSETNSRLGFRGTEDLGGGLSAFFTAEMSLAPASSNQFQNLTNRQSFLGLRKNGLGQAAIGTQYTPMFIAVSSTDVGQVNNVIGSALYPTSGNASSAQASADAALTVRLSNSLTVMSDRFAGFRVGGMYALNNANNYQTTVGASVAGGTNNTNAWGLGVDYEWQKLKIAGAYQSLKSEVDAGNPAAASISLATACSMSASSGQSCIPPFTGTNTTDTQMYVGAVYDFGILKAYIGWQNRKVESNLNSNAYLKRSAQQIGVRSNITKTIEGWASVGNGRYTEFGTGTPTANFNAYQLGANYWLSKRTNLYGIFGATGTSSSTQTLGSANGSQFAMGVRHTF